MSAVLLSVVRWNGIPSHSGSLKRVPGRQGRIYTETPFFAIPVALPAATASLKKALLQGELILGASYFLVRTFFAEQVFSTRTAVSGSGLS